MILSNNFAQDLGKHRWKQRVLILTADQDSNPLYLQQVEHLLKDKNGLAERKLAIYHVFPEKIYTGLLSPTLAYASSLFYQRFTSRNTPFSVTLIGLDGGIKLKQSELLLSKDLFGLIDGMPMRRSELNKKTGKL